MPNNNYKLNRQNGGALLVAIVLIFMLSLMGISSMRGSTLERRMASNSIQTANTFQSAESTTEIALNEEANMTQAYMAGLNNAVDIVIDLKQEFSMEASAKVRYKGPGTPFGYTLGSGQGGGGGFVALRFEIDGDAQIDSVRSRARVTQGAYRIVPAM